MHPDGKLELVLGISPSKHYTFSNFNEHVFVEEVANTPIYMPAHVVAAKDGTIYFIERGYQAVREYHPKRGLHCMFPRALRSKFEKEGPPEETTTQSYYPPYPMGLAISGDTLYLGDAWHLCVYEINLRTKQMKLAMKTSPDVRHKKKGPVALTIGPKNTLWVLDSGENCVCGFQKNKEGQWQRLKTSLAVQEWQAGCASGGMGIVCSKMKEEL